MVVQLGTNIGNVSENLVHQPLERQRRIHKPKMHELKSEGPKFADKYLFLFDIFF